MSPYPAERARYVTHLNEAPVPRKRSRLARSDSTPITVRLYGPAVRTR